MGEQYGQPDLQLFMTGRTQFPGITHHVNPPEILHSSLVQYRGMFPGAFQPFSGDGNLTAMMMGQQVSEIQGVGGQCGMVFPSDSSLSKCGFAVNNNQRECAGGSGGGGGFEEFDEVGDGGNARWPRRETLALLDIRTKMDSKFKETNQKGPLWDEVSRVLADNGYHRSGKKCREKFENLYKYYKKTKEGKAGRQDGKNYRFFNQFEALYGETSNPTPDKEIQIEISSVHIEKAQKPCQNLTSSFQSWDFDTGSSSSEAEEEDGGEEEGKKRRRRNWKTEMKTYMATQIKKFMERQEAWLEKILQTLENKENERVSREKAWRNQESALLEREQKFWADERAWTESRDNAILGALKKLTKEETRVSSPEEETESGNNSNNTIKKWLESEILSLIKLRTGMETSFSESASKGSLWEEISNKMFSLGFDRSATRCKEKWENINKYYWKSKNCTKKRKENSRSCSYFQYLDLLYSDNNNKQFEIVLEENVKDEEIGKKDEFQ